MECEKCGATVDDGAGACPECGEPMPVPVETVTEAPAVKAAAPAQTARSGGNKWLLVVIAILVVAGLGVGGYFAYKAFAGSNSPEAAAKAMLTAYAAYDAEGILDTATHKSLPKDGVEEFKKQAAEAKQRAGGKPGVKDFKIIKTTMDGKEQATVQIEGQWLTDPTKGTYTKRTENLTVVKQDGKWLVKLF